MEEKGFDGVEISESGLGVGDAVMVARCSLDSLCSVAYSMTPSSSDSLSESSRRRLNDELLCSSDMDLVSDLRSGVPAGEFAACRCRGGGGTTMVGPPSARCPCPSAPAPDPEVLRVPRWA